MATYTTQNQPLPYVQPYHQDYLARAATAAMHTKRRFMVKTTLATESAR